MKSLISRSKYVNHWKHLENMRYPIDKNKQHHEIEYYDGDVLITYINGRIIRSHRLVDFSDSDEEKIDDFSGKK